MYKNFKGPLKDQTERIAYTNQYDGLFLIGAKTSDSEKIFSFLFNTENIALAIAQSKEAIQQFGKEFKESGEHLIVVEEELKASIKEADLYIKKYYYSLITEFQDIQMNINEFKIKGDYTDQLYNKVRSFIEKIEAADWLEVNSRSLNEYQNKIGYNNTRTAAYEIILEKISAYNNIQNAISILDNIDELKTRLSSIEVMEPKISSVISIDYFIKLSAEIDNHKKSLLFFNNSIRDLGDEYKLTTCECCSGYGVVPTE
jgi:hypothetical protein